MEIWKRMPPELTIERLVLTAPVDQGAAYCEWLVQACAPMDVGEIALVDEPTAAALGAGLAAGSKLLVVDLGEALLIWRWSLLQEVRGVQLRSRSCFASEAKTYRTAARLCVRPKSWGKQGSTLEGVISTAGFSMQCIPVGCLPRAMDSWRC